MGQVLFCCPKPTSSVEGTDGNWKYWLRPENVSHSPTDLILVLRDDFSRE